MPAETNQTQVSAKSTPGRGLVGAAEDSTIERREIISEIENQGGKVAKLLDRVLELRDRLEPALRLSTPLNDDSNKEAIGLDTQLGQNIDRNSRSILSAVDMLEDILNRLEI